MHNCYIIFTFLLLTINEFSSNASTVKMEFHRHLRHLNRRRHPNTAGGGMESWVEAREYIADSFRDYGIVDVRYQPFNTTLSLPIGSEVELTPTVGYNIIGVIEGLNRTGPVMVVGADFDTTIAGDPFRNNGAGVACLLETIHLFEDNIRWKPYSHNFTVIFVAFDLNTREHYIPGEGHPGSYYFVRDFLRPFLRRGRRQFRGAIILDSVATYNTKNNSQILLPGFDAAFPEAYTEIQRRGEKADFLGFLYRNEHKNNEIVESFVRNYRRAKIRHPFRLQEMNLHLNISTATKPIFQTIDHQAHYNFWTENLENSLPAFLIYDTENRRSDPWPYECPAMGACNYNEFLNDERESFLTKTSTTVATTLLDLQTTRYNVEESSARHLEISLSLIAVTTVVAFMGRM